MDFLTALASRNGVANGEAPPAVQPRIPSRFEPASTGSAPDAGAWLDESSAEIEAARDERRTVQGRDTAPANVPSTTTSSPNITSPTTQNARPASPATHPALSVIERVVHARETQTIRIVEREMPMQPAIAPVMATREESTVMSSPQLVPAQPVTPASQPQPIQPTSVLAPKPPAATKPSTVPTEKPSATPQMPDVHISIGRIEVRAISAAKKGEPRSKPAAPNLERYLNSLSGNSGGDG
jgi:hypothetical protein